MSRGIMHAFTKYREPEIGAYAKSRDSSIDYSQRTQHSNTRIDVPIQHIGMQVLRY